MFTIATAGHIDHGKSSLVRALTGIDPDRLPEEKERQMTIELGFAHFQLTGGEEAGIIDVPGHERFVKTMISGVGAIDMVMFVIAADDGWMPQSEEHLSILSYLGVEKGMIVLTKVDLVDNDWKELVKADLRNRTTGTFLQDCPIIEFSAHDNRNLELVRSTIEDILRSALRHLPQSSARLFVDRIFTVAGTGTVITGTLREGGFVVGQELYHHPSGTKTRIKSLESFYSHLESAPPGVRLAVGLQSLDRHQIQRGDLLYTPARLHASDHVAVKIRLEGAAARHVKNNRKLLFLHGTSETDATIILPQEKTTTDDGSLIAVLRLDSPAVCKGGDRFILRLATPQILIGGGVIVDPLLSEINRKDQEYWRSLQKAATMEIGELILYHLANHGVVARDELLYQSLMHDAEKQLLIERMLESKKVLDLSGRLVLREVWEDAKKQILAAVKDFHTTNPHIASMSLADLKSRLSLPTELVDFALEALSKEGKLERHEAGIKFKEYSAGLSDALERLRQKIMTILADKETVTLTRKEIMSLDKDAQKVYTYLKQNGQIVDLEGNVYAKDSFDRISSAIVEGLKSKGKITVAEVRDLTGTSRKVVLPILEDMDRRRITRREGDYRYLCE